MTYQKDFIKNLTNLKNSLNISKEYLYDSIKLIEIEKQNYQKNTSDSEDVEKIKLKVFDDMIESTVDFIEENYNEPDKL